MKIPRGGIILAFFLFILLLSACGDSAGNASMPNISNTAARANADPAKSDVEELSLILNFPYETEDIVWKQNRDNGTIIAVFRLASDDADKAVADASRFGPGQAVSLPQETWFPEELIAQAEVSGDNSLKGTAYPANGFFQEPYTSGRLTRVEGVDYFILEISPK